MKDFPTPLFTLASEIPILSYPRTLRKYPFRPGEASPYRPLKGVPRGRLDFLKVFFRILLARWKTDVSILGDPRADKGGEGKSKRADKYIWNEEK